MQEGTTSRETFEYARGLFNKDGRTDGIRWERVDILIVLCLMLFRSVAWLYQRAALADVMGYRWKNEFFAPDTRLDYSGTQLWTPFELFQSFNLDACALRTYVCCFGCCAVEQDIEAIDRFIVEYEKQTGIVILNRDNLTPAQVDQMQDSSIGVPILAGSQQTTPEQRRIYKISSFLFLYVLTCIYLVTRKPV